MDVGTVLSSKGRLVKERQEEGSIVLEYKKSLNGLQSPERKIFRFIKKGMEPHPYPIRFGSNSETCQIAFPNSPFITDSQCQMEYSEEMNSPVLICTSSVFPTTLKIQEKKCKLRPGNIVLLGPFHGFSVLECVNPILVDFTDLGHNWTGSYEIKQTEFVRQSELKMAVVPVLKISWLCFSPKGVLEDIEGETQVFTQGETLKIGNVKSNSYKKAQKVIPSPEISRNQALISYDKNGGWNIEDLNSRSGTYLALKNIEQMNKNLASFPMLMQHDQILNIGNHLFRVKTKK